MVLIYTGQLNRMYNTNFEKIQMIETRSKEFFSH